ncbi:hypothetical protein SUGI_0187190 [Cryptomeria japonica]|uniref:flowering locus K homology domain n=1 Tax=Cryptomeria japonica TaxID=3369 RepID=UPI0024089AFA|nr:flowering locus K homology domain [Cryptomeria japonica]GLJ12241.1 hypothetical protein SUGI_0187190 [Cryptomeria japonica]
MAAEGENGSEQVSSSPGAKTAGQKRGREAEGGDAPAEKRWPGWPGETVFRLIVPVQKAGAIIGRKGELVKKMCEDTRARIKILDGVQGTTDRVVLITGREEPDAAISPAMDGILRVHKRVAGLQEAEGDSANAQAASSAAILTRLLVASSQAGSLIGKQGSQIKSIQDGSGANVRVIPADDLSFCALPDDRIVEIQGEAAKVQKALEMVVGHLRKYLVDRSILPLFEQNPHTANGAQDLAPGTWGKVAAPPLSSATHSGLGTSFTSAFKADSLYPTRDTQIESQAHHRGLSLYGKDPGPVGLRSSLSAPTAAPVITQVIQKMQIPLSYADDVIGVEGTNIGYMRRASGATITIQETRGVPNEITVEIKGSTTEVQTAQQLIQNFMAGGGHKKITHSSVDSGYGSYGQSLSSLYPSSSLSSHSLGGYGSSYGTGYGY